MQLATVACLSIAAKMEEGIMPPDITELQVLNLPLHLPVIAQLQILTCQIYVPCFCQLDPVDTDKSTKAPTPLTIWRLGSKDNASNKCELCNK